VWYYLKPQSDFFYVYIYVDVCKYMYMYVNTYVFTLMQVALLRTRPIIMLHSKVNVSPNKLNMSTDDQKTCEHDGKKVYCVEVKLCLRYTAEPVER
jgi:hypothetical protein